MEELSRKTLAGGSLGWGGYINRGNRFVASHESSDCQNVWDNKGTLTMRKGYTQQEEGFVLAGSYTATKSGAKYINDNYPTEYALSQEVEINSTATGGDVTFDGLTPVDLVVGVNLAAGVDSASHVLNCRLYSVSSGFPGDIATGLIAAADNAATKTNWALPTGSDSWLYYEFSNVTLGTSNFCIVMISGSGSDIAYWNYSNTGYAPGGTARKAGYSAFAGGAWTWSEIASADFLFKVYMRKSALNYKSLSEYNDSTGNQYSTSVTIGADNWKTGYIELAGDVTSYISAGMTMFWPSQNEHYLVESVGTYGGKTYVNIFPSHASATTGTSLVYFSPSRIVAGADGYLLTDNYNNWPLRIASGLGTSSKMRCAGFYNSLAIAPSAGVPQVWGTSTYPITGNAGAATFTGLTNAITQAQTVMWYKEHLLWGNVIVNSINYYDRIYVSGQTTGEAGYTDTRHFSVDGTQTASISVGDYAILASRQNTYLLLGDTYATFELVKHETMGGVINQEAMCEYDGKVYGVSQYGLFEIDKMQKTFISEKISEVLLSNTITGDSYVCPDYERNLVLFGLTYYSGSGTSMTVTKKVFAYDPKNKTFWIENLQADGMTSCVVSSTLVPQIYGFNDNELWHMYSGTNDDGVAITAYYKTGPAYLSQGSKATSRKLWLLHGNEAAATTLTVNHYNDYGTASAKTLSLYNSAYAANVPVFDSVDVEGRANSIETEVRLATLDKSFKIGEILVDFRPSRPENQG